MCKFRTLNPYEVELRVAQAGKNSRVWAQYLIYKDARVDQKILDETVGEMRWKKEYTFLEGKLYCTISIWDEELKQWISKQDTGTESNTEPDKGAASDAQKRSAFCWGIGRELYSAPDIFIDLQDGEYTERDGKIYPKNNLFTVQEMNVDQETRKITSLVIVDRNLNIRFSFPNSMRKKTTSKPQKSIDAGVMTKEQFRDRWNSDEHGGGITFDDIADCAKAWGIDSKPKIHDIMKVRAAVLKAAGIVEEEQKPLQHPTDAQLEAMAKRIAAGEDLTDKIQTNFLMSQAEWMMLDDMIKNHTK